MPAYALADVLKDFGAPQRHARPAAVATEVLEAPSASPAAVLREQQTSPLDQAVEEAVQEVTDRLTAEHAAELEALRESHKKEIEQLQAEIGEQTGSIVTSAFDEMEKRLVELTSSVAARILGIALTEDVQTKALDSLAKSISTAARDREAVAIRIHGPLSLYEALQPKLGRHADQVEFTEAAGLDLTVSIDDTLFETRLSEWSASLSEIMT